MDTIKIGQEFKSQLNDTVFRVVAIDGLSGLGHEPKQVFKLVNVGTGDYIFATKAYIDELLTHSW